MRHQGRQQAYKHSERVWTVIYDVQISDLFRISNFRVSPCTFSGSPNISANPRGLPGLSSSDKEMQQRNATPAVFAGVI